MTHNNRKSAPCLSLPEEQLELEKKKEEVGEAVERGERVGVR